MSRVSILIVLGILNMLVPFSGLPVSFRSLLAVVFGACVFSIGLSLRSQEVRAVKPRVESAGSEPAAPPQQDEVLSKPAVHGPHAPSSI